MREYIDAARVLGSKNLDGRLTVASAPGLPFLLQEGMAAHFVPPVLDAPRQAVVSSVAMQGDDAAVVNFDGVDSVGIAEMLIGCHILLSRRDIDEEMLVVRARDVARAFEGWRFVDEASGLEGSIEGVDEMPGQMMLILDVDGGNGDPKMVPFVDDFIVSQDEGGKLLALKLPGGMLDL